MKEGLQFAPRVSRRETEKPGTVVEPELFFTRPPFGWSEGIRITKDHWQPGGAEIIRIGRFPGGV